MATEKKSSKSTKKATAKKASTKKKATGTAARKSASAKKTTKKASKKTTTKKKATGTGTASKKTVKKSAGKKATKAAGSAKKTTKKKTGTKKKAAAKKTTTKKSTRAATPKKTTAKKATTKKTTTKKKAAAKKTTGTKKAVKKATKKAAKKTATTTTPVVEETVVLEQEAQPAPPPPQPSYMPPEEIPHRYGITHIEALVKDPEWLHAYWEITPQSWTNAQDVLREVWNEAALVLRVFDETDDDVTCFDVDINERNECWYIHVGRPNRSYSVAIGMRGPGGMFYEMARSARVTTPRDSISDVISEEWARADAEFAELYKTADAHTLPAGSVDFRELMRQRMEADISSAAVSSWMFSMGSQAMQQRDRGFWFVLDTELIVYGATDPQAKVTVQGRPIQLREDGTFTLRFALPDGKQVIPCVAKSPDGIEERTITPVVDKHTETPEPVIDQEAERAFYAGESQ